MFTWVGIWQKRVRVRRALDDIRPLVLDLESGQEVTHTRAPSGLGSKSQGFPNLALLAFWSELFFIVGSCPVLCAKFSSTLYTLDAASALPPSLDNQKSLQTFPMSPGGALQNHPGLRLF